MSTKSGPDFSGCELGLFKAWPHVYCPTGHPLTQNHVTMSFSLPELAIKTFSSASRQSVSHEWNANLFFLFQIISLLKPQLKFYLCHAISYDFFFLSILFASLVYLILQLLILQY